MVTRVKVTSARGELPGHSSWTDVWPGRVSVLVSLAVSTSTAGVRVSFIAQSIAPPCGGSKPSALPSAPGAFSNPRDISWRGSAYGNP